MKAIALSTTLLLVAGVLAGQDRPAQDKPFDDASFVAAVASSGMHEVELAKLAQTQAKIDAVRKLADTLVTDHTKANDELKKLATEGGLRLPDKMNADHQKVVDTFKNYMGDNFDRDFLKHAVSSHEKSAELFKRASREAKDSKLKDFAAKTLPVIQAHLDAAKKIEIK